MQGRRRQVRVWVVALLLSPAFGALPRALADPPAASPCVSGPDWPLVAIGEAASTTVAAAARCSFLLDLPPVAERVGKQILVEATHDRALELSLAYRSSPQAAWVGFCQIEGSAAGTRCASGYPIEEGEYRVVVVGHWYYAAQLSFTASLVDVTRSCEPGTDPIPIVAGEIVRARVAPELGARCVFRYDGVAAPGEFVRFRLLEDVDVRIHGNVSRAPVGRVSTCGDFAFFARVCTFPAVDDPVFISTVRDASGSGPAFVNLTVETGPVCVIENEGRIPDGGAIRVRMAHFDDRSSSCRASYRPLANSTSFYVAQRVHAGSAVEALVRFEDGNVPFCHLVTFRSQTSCGGIENRGTPLDIVLRESPSSQYSIGESEFEVSALSYDVCSFGLATRDLRADAPVEASVPQLPVNGCKFRIVPPNATVSTRVTVRSLDGAGLRFPVRGGSGYCMATTYSAPAASCTVASAGAAVDVSVHHDSRWGPGRFSISVAFEGPCSLGYGPVRIAPDGVAAGTVRGPAGTACVLELPPIAEAFYDLSWTAASPVAIRFERIGPAGAAPVACTPRLPELTPGTCAIETGESALRIVASLDVASTASVPFTVRADARPACSLGSGVVEIAPGVRHSGVLHDYDGVMPSCRLRIAATDPRDADLVRATLAPGLDEGALSLAAGDRVCEGSGICSVENTGAEPVAELAGRGAFAFTLEAANGCGANAHRGGTLAEGEPATFTISADAAARCVLSFAPEPGAPRVRVDVEGDVEPFVSTTGPPTVQSFECRALSVAPCRLDLAGPLAHVLLPATGREATFRLVARSEHACSLGPGVHALASGEAISARLLDHPDAACEFALSPGIGEDLAAFVATATENGLVVEAAAAGTGSRCEADVAPAKRAPCDVLVGDGGVARVRVTQRPGRADAVAFTLRGETTRIPTLDAAPRADSVEAGFTRYFRVAGPGTSLVATAPDARCSREPLCDELSLAGLRADADLFTGPPDALPHPGAASCHSTAPGRSEACVVEGAALVAVRGVAGLSRVLVSLVGGESRSGAALS